MTAQAHYVIGRERQSQLRTAVIEAGHLGITVKAKGFIRFELRESIQKFAAGVVVHNGSFVGRPAVAWVCACQGRNWWRLPLVSPRRQTDRLGRTAVHCRAKRSFGQDASGQSRAARRKFPQPDGVRAGAGREKAAGCSEGTQKGRTGAVCLHDFLSRSLRGRGRRHIENQPSRRAGKRLQRTGFAADSRGEPKSPCSGHTL